MLPKLIHRTFAAVIISGSLASCGGTQTGDGLAVHGRFYASWTGALSDAAAATGASPGVSEWFDRQSVRQIVRLSLGGDTVRLRVSNLFGSAPATFSGIHLAKSLDGSAIDVSTDRSVTFNGHTGVTLAPGTDTLSDPVALPVAALSNLAVTMYFSQATAMPTVHAMARQTAYLGVGNLLSAASLTSAPADRRQTYFGLAAVETSSIEKTSVVVLFGDSITDGLNSTPDAAQRWANQLDDRLKRAGQTRIGVANEGLSGNRWLGETATPTATSRLERDVLDVAGATDVVFLLGANDIFASASGAGHAVGAEQISSAIDAAVARARARGLKVFLGTLLPFKGVPFGDFATDDMKRQAVNAAIRSAQNVDGVIDFDRVMRDPADPLALDPAYDSGDHLHPSDAGYAAMAAAVELSAL